MAFTASTTAFDEGTAIPMEYTCDGEGRSPEVTWSGVPDGTRSFALIVHDPDAPVGDVVHWLLYDIPADRLGLPENGRGIGIAGVNTQGGTTYMGPCPPPTDHSHRYFFELFALDIPSLRLPEGAERRDVDNAMAGHILAETRFYGLYRRAREAHAAR